PSSGSSRSSSSTCSGAAPVPYVVSASGSTWVSPCSAPGAGSVSDTVRLLPAARASLVLERRCGAGAPQRERASALREPVERERGEQRGAVGEDAVVEAHLRRVVVRGGCGVEPGRGRPEEHEGPGHRVEHEREVLG